MSTTASTTTESSVTLFDVPPDAYQALLPALSQHSQKHQCDDGMLEAPSLIHGVSWDAYETLLDAMGERIHGA